MSASSSRTRTGNTGSPGVTVATRHHFHPTLRDCPRSADHKDLFTDQDAPVAGSVDHELPGCVDPDGSALEGSAGPADLDASVRDDVTVSPGSQDAGGAFLPVTTHPAVETGEVRGSQRAPAQRTTELLREGRGGVSFRSRGGAERPDGDVDIDRHTEHDKRHLLAPGHAVHYRA